MRRHGFFRRICRLPLEKQRSRCYIIYILFMNLDGCVPDDGACVELGIAYGAGKRCYGFKTDTRAFQRGLDLNPMITDCMVRIFKDPDGNRLIEALGRYLNENEL